MTFINRWSVSSYAGVEPKACKKCRSTDVDIINAYSDRRLVDKQLHCNRCQHGESLGSMLRSENEV